MEMIELEVKNTINTAVIAKQTLQNVLYILV